ncbi:hypothetical protein [Paraburkholderia tropica]|uniref:hypothetical protein n=1 Tax=Paraburkholderia tropica TaxID=92647 RepID=UPI002693F93A
MSDAELKLALQIIAQGESETYDSEQYENVEQKRVLAAIDAKIEGQQIVAPTEETVPSGGQVIDLMEALRASLTRVGKAKPASGKAAKSAEVAQLPATKRARTVNAQKPRRRPHPPSERGSDMPPGGRRVHSP